MSKEQRISTYAEETAEILGSFLSTMLGSETSVTSAPATQVGKSDLDTFIGNSFSGLSSTPAPHAFVILIESGLLDPLSKVMLGEAMGIDDPGAADLMMEVLSQGYGTVRNQLSADFTLPSASFTVSPPGSQDAIGSLEDTLWRVPLQIAFGDVSLTASIILTNTTVDALPDSNQPAAAPAAEAPQAPTPMNQPKVDVASAPMPNLGNEHLGLGQQGNFDLLSDVQLDIAVELGRRKIALSDVLSLTMGSILELEKLVGEPLEIYANGRLIAEGEAVVIDEQFGVRVTNLAHGNSVAKVAA